MTEKSQQPVQSNSTTEAANAERMVVLGYIAAAHGIRGEVVIKSFTGQPADIASYGPVTAHNKVSGLNRSISIKTCRETSKGLVARVDGINDRNDAEAMKGCELWVSRAALPKPAEGEFYHEDLIGMTAVDASGNAFGRVIAVENYGAGDLLDIEVTGQNGSELIPFTHAHVPDVHLTDHVVVVNWPLEFEIAPGPEAEPDENSNES
ncbi:MAG: ribosome maturation factor RimM [Pseudomonadota bacterium]